MAVGFWVLLAAIGAMVALQAGPRGVMATVILVVWLAYAVYIGMWAPSLTVDEHGCRIENPMRTITVAWDALIHVETKFALTLFTAGHRWEVWCAPQAGALLAMRKARRLREDRDVRDPRNPLDVGLPIGDLPGTESGDAAALVRERWAAHRSSDVDPDTVPVPVTTHWARAAALVAGPLLAVTVPRLL